MLTGEHAIVKYERGLAIPDRLTRPRHAHYVGYAARMLLVYRQGAGLTRRELHQAVQNIFADEPDCDARRVQSFCKLLDDVSEFDADRKGRASALRLQVFTLAAKYHPLVSAPDRLYERSEEEVKSLIAAELKLPWAQIDAALYADILQLQRLKAFEGYPDEGALLSRYNVAQLQVCLYKATKMTVDAGADFVTILRHAKLCRLLHDIRRTGASRHRIDLSGPASVLQETRRYGVNFARFLASLLTCRDWRMNAVVLTPWHGRATLSVSSQDGFQSHLPAPEEYDSQVEEDFAKDFGAERDGWTLSRDAGILHDHQIAYVPDFILRRADGTEVYLEIVGFWTPEYLRDKREKLKHFRHVKILLAVAAASVKEGAELGVGVVVYKTKLKAQAVIDALNAMCPPAGAAQSPAASS